MLRKTLPCALALLAAAAACSSSPTVGGTGGAPSGPDTSVYDSCVEFASALCVDAEGCCRTAHGEFDQEGCVETFRRDVCRPGADAVTAGRATFNEASIDTCLAAHAQAHAVCTPTWAETLELRREIYAACRVIEGSSEPGLGCSISATCKRPDGVGTAECVKNRCCLLYTSPSPRDS